MKVSQKYPNAQYEFTGFELELYSLAYKNMAYTELEKESYVLEEDFLSFICSFNKQFLRSRRRKKFL